MVEFDSNGTTVGGYLATPEAGAGPGLIVIQEWWGLVDHIKDVCERFAAAVQGHYAEHDSAASPEHVADLEARLEDAGADVEMFIYDGAQHAFFNDTHPEAYDETAARQAWVRTLEFLRRHLG